MIDLHELATERSLAFHREIARRLLQDSTILERARERVRAWETENPERPYVRQWARILEGTPESIAAFLAGRSESAQELRQSSPFAGVLSPAERWRIWNETRDAYARRQ
jgi:hypothetical protein